ncbi:MAG: hypothetical protein WDA71_08890 [Actinomycetota bacterium]
MEQLLQDEGTALGDRFAGAWLNSDGTVAVGITEGPVPEALANRPKVRIVQRQFSTARLDAAMDTVVTRLNALLAPKGAPKGSGNGSWPWQARVNLQDNVVDVEIDRGQASKRDKIEEALADEMSAGTVRIVSYEKSVTQQKTCGSRINCSTPFRGGIEVISRTCVLLHARIRNARPRWGAVHVHGFALSGVTVESRGPGHRINGLDAGLRPYRLQGHPREQSERGCSDQLGLSGFHTDRDDHDEDHEPELIPRGQHRLPRGSGQ